MPASLPPFDQVIRAAIAERRLVGFVSGGHARIGEPHDYGIAKGQHRLFFYQVGGTSQSGVPSGWRWADLNKMSDLRVLDARFAGPRAAPSGRHVAWDRLLASVSRPT